MGSMSRGVSANIRKQPRHTGWYRRDLMSSHEPSFLGSLTMKSNREIQPRPLTAFFGTKVDEISFLQLHQMDLFAALGNPVHEGIPFSATQEGTARTRRKMASAAAEEMRHHFAIETLEKPGPYAHSRIYILAFAASGFLGSMIRAARSQPWTGWAGVYPNPKIPNAS